MTVLVCGVNMFAMAKVLELLLGWNIHFSIWVSSITVAIYVALGGLLSAVFNEVMQFFLIWLGTLLVPILGLIEAGGWRGMMDSISTAKPGVDFTSLWANLGSAADNPMGMHWTGMVFGLGLAVSFGYWCTDFLQVQRVMAAKDLRSAQNGTIIGAAFKMLVPLIVTLPGLLGLAVLSQKAGITLVSESEAQATGGYSYNVVLPLMMARYLGPGLLGLGVTAMIAGFMSGMAGNVSAFATVWTYDVYQPLLRRNASDRHYVAMGRWCSIIGVVVAIGTAYAAMLFSNILVYLQVLVLFFIVPLFGVVITGMLWKQATPAGGFCGLLIGTLASIFMFFYVHWFPLGYANFLERDFSDRSAIQLVAELKAGATPAAITIGALIPESGRKTLAGLDTEDAGPAKIALAREFNRLLEVQDLAAKLGQPAAAGGAPAGRIQLNRRALQDAFPGAIAPMRRLEATQLNPVHAEHIATSPAAQDMAVNMFSGFWSLLITFGTTIMISLFTRPKPDEEIKDLVYGLLPLPSQQTGPWYVRPGLWALVVLFVLVAVNIVFW
jgi:SSS family transporter